MFDKTNSPANSHLWSLPSWVGLGRRAVPISEITLGGHTRMFHVPDERARDDIAFAGLRQLLRNDRLAAQDAPEWLAAHLLFRCRYRYVRAALKGLRGSFRDSGSLAATLFNLESPRDSGGQSLLSCERAAWRQLLPQRTGRYDARRFQHALSELLSKLPGDRTGAEPVWFPIALRAVLDLPSCDSALYKSAVALIARLGQHLCRLASGQLRGPRPKDSIRWVNDKLEHHRDAPLAASREEVLWAIGLSTYFGWAVCYAAGMKLLAEQLAQPLTPEERPLFSWGHVSKDLIGFPIQCLPQGYYNFLEPVLGRFFSGQIKIDDARREIHAVLTGGLALKLDAIDQDRTRKQRKAQAQRQRSAAQRSKRLGRRTP